MSISARSPSSKKQKTMEFVKFSCNSEKFNIILAFFYEESKNSLTDLDRPSNLTKEEKEALLSMHAKLSINESFNNKL